MTLRGRRRSPVKVMLSKPTGKPPPQPWSIPSQTVLTMTPRTLVLSILGR